MNKPFENVRYTHDVALYDFWIRKCAVSRNNVFGAQRRCMILRLCEVFTSHCMKTSIIPPPLFSPQSRSPIEAEENKFLPANLQPKCCLK